MLGVRASLFPGGPCVEPVCSGIIYNGNKQEKFRLGEGVWCGGGRDEAGEGVSRKISRVGVPILGFRM